MAAQGSGIPTGPQLAFTVENINITDSSGNTTQILSGSAQFSVSADLTFSGSLANNEVLLLQNSNSTYTVTYSFESETGGGSGILGTDSGPIAGTTTTSTINVAANTLGQDVYELTGVFVFNDSGGNTLAYFGNFAELLLQVTP